MEKNNLIQPPQHFPLKKNNKIKFFGCYHSVFCRVDVCSCEISSLGQCQVQSKGSSEPLCPGGDRVGWGIGNPHLWPHGVGLPSARQGEMPVLNNSLRAANLRSLGSMASPYLLCSSQFLEFPKTETLPSLT